MHNQSYDEDLSRNDFFNAIQSYEEGELFRKAVEEGWIICVPKAASLSQYFNASKENIKKKAKAKPHDDRYSQNFLMRHIFIPNDELPETHFHTLEGHDVRITGSTVIFIKKDAGK